MKIKSLLLVILIVIGLHSFGQDTLAMYREGKLWGFINLKGDTLIEAKFGICEDFNSGLAKIGIDKFVRPNGEIFYVRNYVKRNLIDVREFSDGYLGVKVINFWGYLNTEGELIIPTKYIYTTDFIGGYAAVQTKEGFFIIDKKGNEQKVMNNEKKKISYIKKFSEGLAPIESKGDLWGFVNEKGEIVIGTMYLGVGYFKGGIAWARTVDNKIGFINKEGDWVIDPLYDTASDYDVVSGLAKVHGKDGWVYVNMKGEEKKFENSRDHQRFSDGMCRETKQMGNAKSGYLNNEGNWAIEPTYGIAEHFNNGYAAVRYKNNWGVIDKKGKWIIEPKYGYIKGFYPVD